MSEQRACREAMDLGKERARQQDWQGAADAYLRAVRMDGGCVEALYELGWSLWRYSEAIKPNTTDLALGYGAQLLGLDTVARERGRKFSRHKRLLRDSAHWLREAIALDPEHADAHFFLAQALKSLGYRSEAIAMARKAAELQPKSPRYATLVQSYTDEGKPIPYEPAPEVQQAKLGWDDLVLAPRTKRELRQMQLMLENPDTARELGIEPPTGILLKGAPGTGKTTIARILANEAKCKFYAITPADINQMYVGVSEQRVRDLFAQARTHVPSIIFIDEIDALLPSRQGGAAIHSDKVVNQFLQEMDGMTPNNRVFIVGATNRPDMLDPAVRRGGRLSREIEIPLPDEAGRLELLRLFVAKVKLAADVDLEQLARDTVGYSGADLRAVVNEAGLQALIRIADEGGAEKVLCAADFTGAVQNLNEAE